MLNAFIEWPRAIFERKFAETAPTVHLPAELLHTENAEEKKYEEHEEHCVTQDWQRTQQ
jgi:hypothetical protein